MATFFLSFVFKEDNENLMENISKERLQEVLHSFQKDKSPRPDGWAWEFFLGFYEVLEEDLLEVVKESKAYGKIPAAYKTTFIALIPKLDSPTNFEEYSRLPL
jgi:hypothetical protein